ncbi:MAG: gamma-glutamyltransferase [Alphaproteobacteria bacterium]|nr:gamma-glutamyltransferase [Alphaproteobacteria bacterium]
MTRGSNFSKSQQVRKPALRTSDGVVAAQHRKAAEVGAAVLADGGNAVDAAIATSFALGAVEPWMSGAGGGGYMLIRRPDEETATVVDFGMRAPGALNPADYPITGEGVSSDLFPWPSVFEDRNVLGPTAIAVPGVIDGMRVALEQFGGGAWDWARLIEPAIALAEQGLTVDWPTQLIISGAARDLARYPKSKETFLEPDGLPKSSAWTALGLQTCDMSALAATLRRIAEGGPREFYEGALAADLTRQIQQDGGCLSKDDLSAYRARIYDCGVIEHEQGRLFMAPELTAGPTLKRVFELLQKNDLGDRFLGGDAYVDYANALFTAYAERLARMGDVEGHRGSTTHFNVVDRQGTMVAVTQTLLSIFGSRYMTPESGLLMNNGVMWFDPEPGKPNSLAPGKRCLSNMCPVLGERVDGYRFALGASGGRKIMPAVAQLASFILDFGMDIEAAFHTPRIDVSGGDTVVADDKLPPSVLNPLSERFRYVTAPRTVYPYNFGCPSAVARANRQNQGVTEIMSPWGDCAAGS